MKRIVTPPPEKFLETCPKCAASFEYENEDLSLSEQVEFVSCPCCKFEIRHKPGSTGRPRRGWRDYSIRIGDGTFTRWSLDLPILGAIRVEHHDNCATKAGRDFTCSNGWTLEYTGGSEMLEAEDLETAKVEALRKVTKRVKAALAVMIELGG